MTRRSDLASIAEPIGDIRGQRFPQYGTHVASGLDWIGSIPSHWAVRRIKHLGRIRYGLGEPPSLLSDGVPFIRATDVKRGKINPDAVQRVDPDDVPWSRAIKLKPGDILVVRSGAYTGDSAIIPGEWSAAIAGYDLVLSVDGAVPEFIAYTMLSPYMLEGQIYLAKSRAAQPHLNADELGSFVAVLPPEDEQRAIVSFLDGETAEIDALIAKKQRLIELLKEKRTALISHAVTKGLNPKAAMKPSGIDWLGDIPAHWRFLRLKFLSTIQSGLTLGKKYNSETTISRPYLRVANVQDGYLDLTEITQVEIPASDAPRFELRAGDVLMTEGGDFDKLGRGYVWEDQIPRCLHQNHIFAVRPDTEHLDSHFLASVLTSSHGKNYFTSTSQQTTNLATTNRTKLGNLCVPLPDVKEQRAILAAMRSRTKSIDETVNACAVAIAKLNEYRSALISAAVTGKIDVRQEVA